MKHIVRAIALLFVAAAWLSASAALAGRHGERLTILPMDETQYTVLCHVPPITDAETTPPPQTILVSVDAVADHLAHGDTEGACENGGLPTQLITLCYGSQQGIWEETIMVDAHAVPDLMAQGATMGECGDEEAAE